MREGYLHLPHSLLAFLRAPQVHKVGVKVSGDLTRLFNDCGFVKEQDAPFTGAVDLGKIAKDRGAAAKATISLADLSASILKRYLPKDPAIRVSEEWNTVPLPTSHANYAALDVYATWAIFQALTSSSIGEIVTSSLATGGTPVTLFSANQSREVALGHITLEQPKNYDGTNVMKTQVLVVITDVLVPGYLIPHDLTTSNNDTPLSAFPTSPFSLV